MSMKPDKGPVKRHVTTIVVVVVVVVVDHRDISVEWP